MESGLLYEDGLYNSYCRMCSYRCGIEIHVEAGAITKIDGCGRNPFSRGKLCIKGKSIKELVYHPARLCKPLKRVGSSWKEIALDQACSEIAERIQAIIDQYGVESIGVWKGEALGSETLRDIVHLFAHALGTPNVFSNDTLCAVSKKGAIKSVYGSYIMPDLDQAESIIVWGANPNASHPPVAWKINEARKKGLRVILIDPRRTSFYGNSDCHIKINPATDGALALYLINTLVKNNKYDKAFVDKYSVGFSELRKYADGFTQGFVEKECGIPASDLDYLYSILAETRPKTCFMVGVGPEHHDNGFNNIRAIAALGAVCGAVDRPGGSLLPEPGPFNSIIPDSLRGRIQRPIGADLYPVFYDNHQEGHTILAMDAMDESLPYPLKAMVMTGANPILTNPDSARLKKALASLDLFIVRDLFMTETAKLAHYVIPAETFLERSELINSGIPQTIALTNRILQLTNCQGEYTFFRNMAIKMGLADYFPWKDEDELNRWIIDPLKISPEELSSRPEGYTYASYRYEKFITEGFATKSGRIEFASKTLEQYGYPRLPEYKKASFYDRDEKDDYNYLLITGARNIRFNHSCYHNIAKLKKSNQDPLLEMNRDDALELNIADGEEVKVTSAVGFMILKVKVEKRDIIKRGCVHIPHAYSANNVNKITSADIRDPVSGFPAIKSVPVKIEPLT